MEQEVSKVISIKIEEEMKKSYIDYAMSVIIGRALPDVRDGLKPVHRRILFAVYEMGLTADKPHRKSARVVGDVLARFHPHGDTAVYDSLVRLAQVFALRYPLIDGQGNFGSVDGDSAAAMRYTETRMTALAQELLHDIGQDTVDFVSNYDDSEKEPVVLPARFPNLLVNGSSGIAVGMATNIPPHNLREIITGLIKLIDNPEIQLEQLTNIIKGPDFPTGATIMGRDGIIKAYKTGRGIITLRAKTVIETEAGRTKIIVTEIPYQVNKARLIEKIALLVREKKIEGIVDLRDESDRTGMRIVIELRRDINPNVLLNQLYRNTQLQDNFGIIMLTLVNGRPQVLGLKEILSTYLEFRKEVVTRRSRYDLRKAEERMHIVDGLQTALANIDLVIQIIKKAKAVDEARQGLMSNLNLSEVQAQAILDMRLQRLTGLERLKLETEQLDLINKIKELQSILNDDTRLLSVIKEDLTIIKNKYGDDRRTAIVNNHEDLEDEDLIPVEDVVITITQQGYVKRQTAETRNQKRGGRGSSFVSTKAEDYVRQIFITTTHHYLLFFTTKGKIFRLKVHEISESGKQSKGTPLVNLIYLDKDESVTNVIPVKDFDNQFLVMATYKGTIKKTPLREFDSSRKDGLIGILLNNDDLMIGALLTTGDQDVLLTTVNGMTIRFNENDIRPTGRATIGVKGIQLTNEDHVTDLNLVESGKYLLAVSELGYGKRTSLDEYRLQRRGGRGIFTMKLSEVTGKLIAAQVVDENEEVMIISNSGIMIRMDTEAISVMGRVTRGVKLMRLNKAKVTAIARIGISDILINED